MNTHTTLNEVCPEYNRTLSSDPAHSTYTGLSSLDKYTRSHNIANN